MMEMHVPRPAAGACSRELCTGLLVVLVLARTALEGAARCSNGSCGAGGGADGGGAGAALRNAKGCH